MLIFSNLRWYLRIWEEKFERRSSNCFKQKCVCLEFVYSGISALKELIECEKQSDRKTPAKTSAIIIMVLCNTVKPWQSCWWSILHRDLHSDRSVRFNMKSNQWSPISCLISDFASSLSKCSLCDLSNPKFGFTKWANAVQLNLKFKLKSNSIERLNRNKFLPKQSKAIKKRNKKLIFVIKFWTKYEVLINLNWFSDSTFWNWKGAATVGPDKAIKDA